MLVRPTLLVTAFGFASSVHAWGSLGHKTVANVATQFIQESTRARVEDILFRDGHKRFPNPTLVDVATWADDFGHSRGGSFSKTYHYIDAKDDPPFACNVDLARDCDNRVESCIVKAIANYTQQLNPPRGSANDAADALKFLVHFIGDITQPLHTEDKARGGNDISVLWKNDRKKLHGVWDTDMVTALAGRDTPQNMEAWTTTIVDEINDGIYKDKVSDWLRSTDVNDALDAALDWARDTNGLVCSYVLATDPEGKDVSGSYSRGAGPIIQEQIAKGGVRLAVWLNQLFGTEESGSFPLRGDRLVVQDGSL